MWRVPVLGPEGEPLMPTKPQRARRWLKEGKAKPVRTALNIFAVQLLKEPSGREKQEIVVGIDPGSKFSGVGVSSKKGVLYGQMLILPDYVHKRMDTKRMLRRNRRYRKTRRRPCRFDNRTGHWLAPSIRARKELELRIVRELSRIFPVSQIVLEDVAFNHYTRREGTYFSQVEVGKNWLISQLEEIAPVTTFQGWETSVRRKELGLEKTPKKEEQTPESHVNDAIALASLVLGPVELTDFDFDVVRRPKLCRRQLHLQNPAKGGVRRKYGGTTTPFIFRKGDFVRTEVAGRTYYGWVSGYTKNRISVSDFEWKRIGQFSVKKTTLLNRNSGLILKSMEERAIPPPIEMGGLLAP